MVTIYRGYQKLGDAWRAWSRHTTFDIDGSRPRVPLTSDALPQDHTPTTQLFCCEIGQAPVLFRFVLIQHNKTQMSDAVWRRNQTPHTSQRFLVQRTEAPHGADTIKLRARYLSGQLALKLFVFELYGGYRVHEVAGCYPASRANRCSKSRERFFSAPLPYVQLVEEAGGVDEVEGSLF